MRWRDVKDDFLQMLGSDKKVASQLVLSKREADTLRRAHAILSQVRDAIENEYGEDEAIEVAEPWVVTETRLYEVTEELGQEAFIQLPPRTGR